jgi:hypothetical protein
MTLKATWVDGHRLPRAKPDPEYPNGIDVDTSGGAVETCVTTLPYPAPRCGMYVVACDKCWMRVVVTTAGRIDDPRSLKVACKVH